jgi:hypothetical protein
MLALIEHQPVFTPEQIARISNIFDNAGQVALGGAIISQLVVPGFDIHKLIVLVCGVVTVLVCWIISIWLAKKEKGTYDI